MTHTWTKLPPDGANYSHWQRDDGWLIETKPRFRPSIPYELNASPAFREAAGGAWPLQFVTLADAKAAAEWPREQLLDRMREEYEDYQALWAKSVTCAGPESTLERIHADALDEHARFPKRFLQPWINDVETALHAFREATGGGAVVYSSPFDGVVLPLGTVARLDRVVLLSDDESAAGYDAEALPLFQLSTETGETAIAYMEEIFPEVQTPTAVDAFCALMGQVAGAFRVSRSHRGYDYADPLHLATDGPAEHLRAFREDRAAESVLTVADLSAAWGVGCFRQTEQPRAATRAGIAP